MIIYNTDKTSKEHNRLTLIKKRILVFGSIALLGLLSLVFLGLYIAQLYKIPEKSSDDSAVKAAEKDSIAAILVTNIKNEKAQASDPDSYSPFYKIIVGYAQQAIFPWATSASPKRYIFNTVDVSSVNINSYKSETKDYNTVPSKPSDWHTIVTADFDVTVQANLDKDNPGDNSSFKVDVLISYDCNNNYLYGLKDPKPIEMPANNLNSWEYSYLCSLEKAHAPVDPVYLSSTIQGFKVYW